MPQSQSQPSSITMEASHRERPTEPEPEKWGEVLFVTFASDTSLDKLLNLSF